MATTTTTKLSTDVYDIAKIVEAIKQKYTEISEDTLALGIYGYFNEMHTNILENTTVMAANYANEAVPTKAKFERNVICHAVSLGINNIRATPAAIQVLYAIPEKELIANMQDDTFILDKEITVTFGSDPALQYDYILDYDIVIKRNLLPTGKYVYTAYYNMNKWNEVSDIDTPYLPAIAVINYGPDNFIALSTILREVTHSQVYKKITVTNPLETMTVNFGFENQLAYFYVEAVEDGVTHTLECCYDGLYSTKGNEYCNYMYIDDKNIRIKFNRDSYQPRTNADVTVHVFTTHGSACNFSYKENIQQELQSKRFGYKNMYCIIRPLTDSQDGVDKMGIEAIRAAIPKQMLMRNSVTTYTDLNNYFNSLNNEYIRLLFLEKIHNQEERLFYTYLLLKDDNLNIIPTNTVDVTFSRDMFANINRFNYTLAPGSMFYHDKTQCKGIEQHSDADVTRYDSNGFLYFNPFLTVINKNPFFVSYYLNVLDYSRAMIFDYVNDKSEVQFIAGDNITVKRAYFTDRDTYKLRVLLTQNITSDFGLVATDDSGTITSTKVKLFGVVYIDGSPYRYLEATLTNYDDKNYIYTFDMTFKTNDVIDKNGKIYVTKGLTQPMQSAEVSTYLPTNIELKMFVLAKFDEEFGRAEGSIDAIIPSGLTGYTLCNIYSAKNGIDLYYDYSNIVGSYITLKKNDDSSYTYFIKKMPMVRWTYMNTEARYKKLVNILEKRRLYMENCLVLLEDSFGIDFKFFNTYGPSLLYYIDQNTDDTLNKVNLSLTFEVKYNMPDDAKCQPEITNYIKEYLEDINDIRDLHFSVLQGKVLDKFSSQLVYFQLYDVNGYSNDHQNFYKRNTDEFVEAHTVPEFINVNTNTDETADIKYRVIS